MKNTNIYSKLILLSGFIFMISTSCEREYSDDITFAKHSDTPEIFIDGFMGGLDYFPFGGSYAEAFTVDTNESYKGNSSMRFDIPAFGVGYGGATFPSTAPRDLSGYDALTFWAKATKGADINEIGFGINPDNNHKYQVSMKNMPITTQWKKYIIPIPDASKLIEEKGMFWYAEGAENANDESGYTFWIDELKFEKLGNIAQPRPAILNGENKVETNFLGSTIDMSNYGLSQTFNLASGVNQTVTAAASYFSFDSSNIEVARVSEAGIVSIIGPGTAKITASIAGVKAEGSLTLNVAGAFPIAPVPSVTQNNVLSIFSDQYTNLPVNYYNGYWAPYQTTQGEQTQINGQNVLNYTEFNFVGTQLTSPLDISEMTHFSVDILMQELPTDIDLLLTFKNENDNETTFQQNRIGQSYQLDPRAPVVHSSSDFEAGVWETIKIPIRPTSETSLDKTGVNLIIIENIKSSNVNTLYLDNMYFYKE
ncbi:glycosyl hydrolase family 16 [Bacteroidota bacterium]